MKKFYNQIKLYLNGIGQNDLSAHAASCAFYMFLSLVPFVGLAVSILPYTGLSQQDLISFLSSYIPDALEDIIVSVTDDIYFASDAVLPITIITGIYLSSRAFSALIRGVEALCGSRNYTSFLKRSILACIYTVGIIIAMVLILAMLIFGKRMVGLISAEIPLVSPLIALLIRFRFLLAILILSGVFTLIYRYVPEMKLGFGALLPGSVFAACAWLLFTWGFSLFLKLGIGFSTYGNLAAIVICLLWMYWCMFIILLGAYTNVFIFANKNGSKSEENNNE